jgi:hypothetical protein
MACAHGTRSRYNAGCACARCRKANTAYMQQHSLGKLSKAQLRDALTAFRRRVELCEQELARRG